MCDVLRVTKLVLTGGVVLGVPRFSRVFRYRMCWCQGDYRSLVPSLVPCP